MMNAASGGALCCTTIHAIALERLTRYSTDCHSAVFRAGGHLKISIKRQLSVNPSVEGATPQRRAAERRGFCVGFFFTVDRSAGVRDGDVRVGTFTPGERLTKFCRLLPRAQTGPEGLSDA
jgi:hypothetical protein